ncbi:site-2 protease family protein [Spirulina sp. CCNP1310]|uniref:site-2 protease family protein n=1 Tax=Spirulina sp. CCNP1310 TaxID=3110249 RepID=UPI002B1F476B|nr:site-2 protease family protein [Spirulina sp. CCNP1310]MEA5419569.1 site-2 protease family protein [Spirulina sp. CCNP1310]
MFSNSEAIATLALITFAFGFLVWGYSRAKPYGKLGILAWLQSVVLITPWLVFFGLVALGLYLNFIAIILLLVGSSAIYIYLGNRLRAEGQDEILRQRATQRLNTESIEAENAPALNLDPETAPIPLEDLQKIKGIFGIDTFFATETIAYQDGAIFRGNLRGDPDVVYERLAAKLKDWCDQKYRLFLVESPEGKPIVIVLPSTNDPQPLSLAQKNLAIVLTIATLATTLEAASLLQGFDLFSNLGRYGEVLPLAIGVWVILAVHELGHWLYAQRYGIKLSFPFLLPSWQIGTFGSLTRFASLVPHRAALFDVAIAGPAFGGLISIILLLFGLVLSQPGHGFAIPTSFFQGSILVGALAKTILRDALQGAVVEIHPLTILGWLGLVITALNLMPAGQLDGGRIVQAIYGRKTARRTTLATLIVLGIVGIFNFSNPIPLYWGMFILFLQRDLERPSLNELSEPDDARAAFGLLALFLMLATLIPLSPGLAERFGIG